MKKNTSEDTQSMKKVFELSVMEIEKVLDRKKPITDITRLAANTLSNYSRIKSTEIHDKGIELKIARKDIKTLPESTES
jgi:hypothetical protein